MGVVALQVGGLQVPDSDSIEEADLFNQKVLFIDRYTPPAPARFPLFSMGNSNDAELPSAMLGESRAEDKKGCVVS
jgi:hypothetical protein